MIESGETDEGFAYFRYSDGWVRQFGEIKSYTLLTLPIEMKDTKYCITGMPTKTAPNNNPNLSVADVTTTGFQFAAPSWTGPTIKWSVEGWAKI